MRHLRYTAMTAILVFAAILAGCGSSGSGSAESFVGRTGLPADAAVVVDAEGDVRDVDGAEPPDDARAADIVHAGISLSEDGLLLAVEQATAIPSDLGEVDYATMVGEWLSYTLYLAPPEGEIFYMPQVNLVGSEWTAYVYDRATMESAELEGAPTVSGAILAYTFPRALLPELTEPFRWSVGTEWARSTGPQAADRIMFGDHATEDGNEGWAGYPYQWAEYPE